MMAILRAKTKAQYFKGQNYDKIRSELSLKGELFEDPFFPPAKSSLGIFENDSELDNVIWKRPGEIFENACLFVPSQSHQGAKAGCKSSLWVVSACSVLSGVPELFHRVIPDPSLQEWRNEENSGYVGMFQFRFWHFGHWISVVVDDKLPTINDQLIYTTSCQPGEVWIPLLEKAYAKLHGSYQGLDYGHLSDALVDFTGGVAETYELNIDGTESSDDLSHLMETITNEINDHSVVCLKINVRGGDAIGDRIDLGLHRGDVYQITSTKYISLGETKLQNIFSNRNRIPMIRFRDTHGKTALTPEQCNGSPDGNKSSETFAYSTNKLSRLLSRNPKWAQVKESEFLRMGLSYHQDREFWMPLDDIIVFDEITVIHFYTNNAFALLQRWRESVFTGHWTQGMKGTSMDRSGGCMEFQDTFLRNPQYAFDIAEPGQTLVIQLLHWIGDDQTKFVCEEPLPLLIGFCMIKVEENRSFRLNYQWDFCPTVVTIHPVRKRQIFYCGTLPPGRYVLIPHTYRPGEIGGYFLRAFVQAKINLRALQRDRPRQLWPRFLFAYPTLTSVVVVESVSCEGSKKETDLWIQLKCEGKKVKTNVSKSDQPSWNVSFIFYRSKPEKAISVKLYSQRWHFFNKLIGQAELPAPVNRCLSPLQVMLRDKLGDPTTSNLSIQILTNDSIFCA